MHFHTNDCYAYTSKSLGAHFFGTPCIRTDKSSIMYKMTDLAHLTDSLPPAAAAAAAAAHMKHRVV